jgi:hypothetical protein
MAMQPQSPDEMRTLDANQAVASVAYRSSEVRSGRA